LKTWLLAADSVEQQSCEGCLEEGAAVQRIAFIIAAPPPPIHGPGEGGLDSPALGLHGKAFLVGSRANELQLRRGLEGALQRRALVALVGPEAGARSSKPASRRAEAARRPPCDPARRRW
jgi:hypothetical protein